MRILVVGGGTAGLISGIILKKYLDVEVDIIFSSEIGIVGVGEGSTEHFSLFMDLVGIDDKTIIKECDATYKAGILFENWGTDTYMHNVTGTFSVRSGEYSFVYGKQISEDPSFLYPQNLIQNKINKWFLNKDQKPFNQYHFNTYKLNEFLKKVAMELGINIFDDIINEVIFDESGRISSVIGNVSTYNYDFYIDSTGFKKVLIGKMGASWKSVGEFLPMNSAITFPTPDTEEYNMWTLARAMNNGWMFRLPVWGRYGNGYIYDKNFASEDEIKEEIFNLMGTDITFGKSFNFDPGYLKNPWIKNCVAVGLSSSFIEPLEATSIGSTIQQSFLLMHKIASYSEKDIERYNQSFNDIMENIVDFVFLHYMTNRGDTNFWKHMKNKSIPKSLSENLEVWKYRLPIAEDFSKLSNYIMFREANFTVVLNALNMFDREKIKNEFLLHNENVRKEAELVVEDQKYFEKNVEFFGHKEMLKIIREHF